MQRSVRAGNTQDKNFKDDRLRFWTIRGAKVAAGFKHHWVELVAAGVNKLACFNRHSLEAMFEKACISVSYFRRRCQESACRMGSEANEMPWNTTGCSCQFRFF